MGRQVNFFMTTEDEEDFLDFVKTTGQVKLFPHHSKRADFESLQHFPDPIKGNFAFMCYLFNGSVSSNIVVHFVKEQGYYVIDALQSSVIEFSRSIVKEKSMRRGRIWADFNFLGRERMVFQSKEMAFQDWYETVAKWLRKHLKRIGPMIYASPRAMIFKEEGGVLKFN